MKVRVLQLLDEVRHRLLFLPALFVIAAIALAQTTLWIDGSIDSDSVPDVLSTTVESARSILTAIAGGLITAITLLLSMMLVAVQLASSQFSPRTLRNWIGDRSQQAAIGVVLGATVFCLLVLRRTRTLTEGDPLVPNVSVLVAVVLGIGSLVAVVSSVDQLTNRLRIGSVASDILADTVATIERTQELVPIEDPAIGPAGGPVGGPGAGAGDVADHGDGAGSDAMAPPDGAHPVVVDRSGWVQQIDLAAAVEVVPEGATLYLPLSVGSFVFPDAPVAWIWPAPMDPAPVETGVLRAIAVGRERTLQQDIGFGIVQMVDIALRALSPGVNDPNTASDLVAHLGVTMLKLWERPVAPAVHESDGRTVIRRDLDHADYLHAAFDPIRIYGAHDPGVASTMIRTLQTLRTETERRNLPGPLDVIDEVIAEILDAVEASDLAEVDRRRVAALVAN